MKRTPSTGLTLAQARERCARGAKLLDERYVRSLYRKDWFYDIEFRSLNMQSGTSCMLGQLDGDYGDGCTELFGPRGMGAKFIKKLGLATSVQTTTYLDEDDAYATLCGFVVTNDDPDMPREWRESVAKDFYDDKGERDAWVTNSYAMLKVAWAEEISKRLVKAACQDVAGVQVKLDGPGIAIDVTTPTVRKRPAVKKKVAKKKAPLKKKAKKKVRV